MALKLKAPIQHGFQVAPGIRIRGIVRYLPDGPRACGASVFNHNRAGTITNGGEHDRVPIIAIAMV